MPIKRPRRASSEPLAKRARTLECTDPDNQRCCFCEVTGSQRACQGILLGPFTVKRQSGRGKKHFDVYAHRNCAIWAPEVWEYLDPETSRVVVMGVESAFTRSRRSKCMVCRENGASLACLLKGKACCRNLHFRCALIAGAVLLPWTAYTVLCPKHKHLNLSGDRKAYPERMRHAQTPIPPHLLDNSTSLFCQGCDEDNYRLESGALLVCGSCNIASHARCLKPPILRDGMAAVKSSQGHFRCERCIECSKCHVQLVDPPTVSNPCESCHERGFRGCRCGAKGDFLTCILCRISVHKSCIGVSVKRGEPFRCVTCRICTHCDQVDILNWDESIAACGVCSTRHSLGHICPACNKVYPEEDSEPMVWCNYCSRWFHGQCGGLDDSAFSALEDSDEKWSCPSCTEDLKLSLVTKAAKKLAVKKRVREKRIPRQGGKTDPASSTRKVRRSGRLRKISQVIVREASVEESDKEPASLPIERKPQSRKSSPEVSSVDVCDISSEDQLSPKEDQILEEEGADTPTGREIVLAFHDGVQGGAGRIVAPKLDLCFLCGSGGPPSSLRFCFDCGEAYHGYCLSPPLPTRELQPRTNSLGTLYRLKSGGCGVNSLPWRCWRCTRCEICKSSSPVPSILICDHCDRGFNPLCLNPPILEVPKGAFTCADCSICDLCGWTASSPSRIQDHIFCKPCALIVQKSPPCPVCCVKYPSFPLDSQMNNDNRLQSRALARKCTACHSIVHEDCDPSIASPAKSTYTCTCCRGEPLRMSEVSDQDLGVTINLVPPEENKFIVGPGNKIEHKSLVQSTNDLPPCQLTGGKGHGFNDFAVHKCWEVGDDCRRCYLCNGAEGWSSEQRLLPWGNQLSVKGDLWIHASCAFWSKDFYLSGRKKGLLCVNRTKLGQQMKKSNCIECSALGATLICAVSGCTASYHYPCAVRQSCRFVVNTKDNVYKHSGFLVPLSSVKDVFMLCPNHVRMQDPDADSDDYILDDSDEVDLACPLRLHVPLVSQRKVLASNAGVRVGSLTVLKIGKLMPRTNAFIVGNALITSGYIASRRYWSFRNPGQRTEYTFTIDGDDTSGPKWSITVADDPDFKIQGSSAFDAWQAVQNRLMKGRLTTSAEEAFGAASVRGVISLIERLPYASLFGGRYKFWYVFPNNPVEVKPLAQPYENFTGSARTEGYIPRRLLLKEEWLKADPLPPTYDNAPTGQMFQFQVAMEQAEEPQMKARSRRSKVPYSCPGNSVGAARKSPGLSMSTLPYAMQYRCMRKSWRFNTRVLRSNIEGWGVFAVQDIAPDEMVIEYAGELVRSSVSDLREAHYERKGMGCYLFRIQRSVHIVDATMKGSDARFINHSCDPNCLSKTVLIEPGRRVIVIFAKRHIARGEELTYDYLFEFEEGDDRQPCKCGAANCRRWMN